MTLIFHDSHLWKEREFNYISIILDVGGSETESSGVRRMGVLPLHDYIKYIDSVTSLPQQMY